MTKVTSLKKVRGFHKAPTKEPEFDLEHAKETFMEAKKSFMEVVRTN